MDESRVAQLVDLFARALELPATDRSAFVANAAGDDAALHEELTSLLQAHDSAPGYFDGLATDLIAPTYAAMSAAASARRDAALSARLQAALGDRYRVLHELGGTVSRVFLAEEVKLGRKVVIKVLPPGASAVEDAGRFRREIQVAAQLQHPHIVPLLTSDVVDSLPFYTMPFVAGESLRSRLARDGALGVPDATKIWRDVLDALAYAHARGVIHRDVKPANILLSSGNALVSDFGVARALEVAGGDGTETATGVVIGTPAYMAPEQVTGDRDADHRVDLYAAGLVMFEMLEGRLPFSGGSLREVTLARLTREPGRVARPDCPGPLAGLVARCLTREPSGRPESAAAILAALATIAGAPITPARRVRRATALAAAGLLGAVGLFGMARLLQDRRGTVAPAAPPAPSVAVLPFESFSADSTDAALAAGFSEDLSSILSGVGRLRVPGGASVATLASQGLRPREIAESLHVSSILSGRLQKIGQSFRMEARLFDPRTDSTRWSVSFDRRLADIFVVQDSIVALVAREPGVAVAGGPMARGQVRRGRSTPSPDAYQWYLRGLAARSGGDRRAAISLLEQSIATDSTFSRAHATLAGLLVYAGGATPGNYRDVYARAQQAALAAARLDDSLPDALVALGMAAVTRHDWVTAEATLQRALALDPHNAGALDGLGFLYEWTGRKSDFLAATESALALDPFNFHAMRRKSVALSINGRCDDAINLLRPLQAVRAPAEIAAVVTGQCYVMGRKWDEAIDEFRWGTANRRGNGPIMALAFLAYAQARAGQRAEATSILADLMAGRQDSHGAFGIATVYAGLGNFDQAFAWLDRSVDDQSVRPLLMGPMFDELRRDPRFVRIKVRLGLP